jgi:hypothetical protein
LLAIIVALATALRLYDIGRTALSLDEFWNAELSTGRGTLHETAEQNRLHVPPPGTSLSAAPAWWTIPPSLDRVTHPPLYSIALRFWREAVGSEDGAMRAYSAIAASLAILPLFAAARLYHGPRAALWACAIYAIASTAIASSREVRPYGQLVLLAWLCVWQVARIEHRGRASWLQASALAATALAMMFTQYFSIGLLAALATHALFRFDRISRRRALVTTAIAAVAFLASWLPMVLRQYEHAGAEAARWLRDPEENPRWMTLLRAADLPMRLLIEPRNDSYPAPYFAIGFVLAAAVLAWWRRQLTIWLTILAGVGGLIFVLDLLTNSRMLDFPRYTLTAAPAMAALLAAVVCDLRGWPGKVAPAVMTAAVAVSIPVAYAAAENLDYRPFAAHLDQVDPSRDAVVFYRRPGWQWKAGFLYVAWSHYSRFGGQARCAFVNPSPPDSLLRELRDIAGAGGRVWFVSSDGPVREMLASLRGWRQVDHRGFLLIGDVSRIEPDDGDADDGDRRARR